MPRDHTDDTLETAPDAVDDETARHESADDDDENDDHRLPPLVLTCDLRGSMLFSWVMTAVVAGGAGYLLYKFGLGENDWKRDWPILIALRYVFPGIGLLAVLGSLMLTLRWRKQGVTKLMLRDGHVSMGGRLRASIRTPRKLEMIGPAVARLECMAERSYRTNSNKSRVETTNVWHEEQPVEPGRMVMSARQRAEPDDGTRFDIDFKMPSEAEIRGTKAAVKALSGGGTTRFKWVLRIQAATRGMDHEAKFDLPVVR